MSARSQFVYFIQAGDDGPVKIGISIDVEARLRALQSASPQELHILGHFPGELRHETFLHDAFREDWLHGEWFRPSPELLQASQEGTPDVPEDYLGHEESRGSIELLVWAWEQDVAPLEKLVLLAMASSSPNSVMAPERIASDTGIPASDVEVLIDGLRVTGFIRRDGLMRGRP